MANQRVFGDLLSYSSNHGRHVAGSYFAVSIGLLMGKPLLRSAICIAAASSVAVFSSCGGSHGKDPAAEAPPQAKVLSGLDVSLFKVDHPEQFPIVQATAHSSSPELVVTGTVAPDISRAVPVISLATGRVVAIHARLGDTVKRGQLLLSVRSDDIAGGFSDYRKAVRSEELTRIQLQRAKDLYDHGAMALGDFQAAEAAEDNAKVDVETTSEHLKLRGSDLAHPTGIVDILAPVSGVITDQEVTNAAGVNALGSTNPFTISDLSRVWIICDVYENDLTSVHLGDTAEIRLNAWPDRVLRGPVSNIGAILDPSIRTAKVRVEVQNPGYISLGMFVKATFRGRKKEMHTEVPATAIVHIHDRDWVYVPAPGNKFRRVEVVGGDPLPNNLQEITTGIDPGQQVVSNAVVLDHAIEQ